MEIKIIDHHLETPTVTSFKLVKPAGFNYLPGQFLNIEIPIENCDNRCNKRNFSIASSPTDDYLMFATRHGMSRFKQTVVNMPVGTTIKILGPMGRFILNEDPSIPAVMLTGGIGITPLHSMMKYATVKNLSKPMTLIYSNRTPDDVTFKTDLDELDKKNEYLIIHHTITEDTTWAGRKGRINEAMIKELVPNLESVEFYVCGRPSMVETLRGLLKSMNIPPERIKFEQFTGYQ